MVLRNIVKIDEEKCNGCGLCVTACAEGAIKIVNGKAKLVSETYCDGLGACLGYCPQNAITIEQRQAEDFNEQAVKERMAKSQQEKTAGFVCPGVAAREIKKNAVNKTNNEQTASQLGHWPVQLKLISPLAPFLQGAELLLTADCVPFAMGDFHNTFLKDKAAAVGCPKLDDKEYYIDKLAQILRTCNLSSLTVIHMEVPCCSGLSYIAEEAVKKAGVNFSFEDVTITLDGQIKARRVIRP